MKNFIKNLDINYVVAGAIVSVLILVAYAVIYNLFLIELVKNGNNFFGSFYIFVFLILFPLLISTLIKNLSLIIGNVLGVVLYIFVVLPIMMILSGG